MGVLSKLCIYVFVLWRYQKGIKSRQTLLGQISEVFSKWEVAITTKILDCIDSEGIDVSCEG